MCGIVGLFLKNPKLEPELGQLTAVMLEEMCDRGPDSAGFAVYGNEAPGITKICVVGQGGKVDWNKAAKQLEKMLGATVSVETIAEGLGVSEGTVKTQLHRARKALAARLRKEDHHD